MSALCKVFMGTNEREAHCRYSKTVKWMEFESPTEENQPMATPKTRGTKVSVLCHL